MKTRNIIYSFCSIILIISACTSTTNTEENPEEVNVRELLMNEHGWRLVNSTVAPDVMGSNDMFSHLDSCDKDDIEYYKEGGVAIYDEGELRCNPDDAQQFFDKWDLLDDNKTLIIYFEDIEMADTFHILSISKYEMVSQYKDEVGGREYTYTDTYMVNKKGDN